VGVCVAVELLHHVRVGTAGIGSVEPGLADDKVSYLLCHFVSCVGISLIDIDDDCRGLRLPKPLTPIS